MIQINDFKTGQKAYILYKNFGYNRTPEILETTVTKVGRRYVTVSMHGKQFERQGTIDGLIEHAEYGNLGILFPTKERAEIEKEEITLMRNIRFYSKYLYKCTYEELTEIMDILKTAEGRTEK